MTHLSNSIPDTSSLTQADSSLFESLTSRNPVILQNNLGPARVALSKRLTILNCPQIFDCLRDDPKISSWQEFEQGQQMATTFIEHLLDHDGDFSSPLIKFEENKVLPRVR